MKRITALLISLLILCSCAQTAETPPINEEPDDGMYPPQAYVRDTLYGHDKNTWDLPDDAESIGFIENAMSPTSLMPRENFTVNDERLEGCEVFYAASTPDFIYIAHNLSEDTQIVAKYFIYKS